MSTAYRSAYDHIVGLKLAETEDARAQLEPLMPGLRRIAGKRIARMAAGAVGMAGGLAMITFAIVTDRDATTTYTLVGSSIAMLATWLFGRGILGVARRFQRTRGPWGRLALSGVLDDDLARIDASDPRTELTSIENGLGKLEAASVWMPATGVALLVPLLLHFLFISLVGNHTRPEEFDEWIRVSLVIVGHAHIALVVLCVLFAKKLRRMSTDEIAQMKINREWAKIWLIVIGISCLPGIILYLVPPILVAITGLAVIPLLITTLYRAILRERTELAFAEAAARVRVDVTPALVGDWLARCEERVPSAIPASERAGARVRSRPRGCRPRCRR